MADEADVTRWKVTGALGELGDAVLGNEVLLVVRGTVARLADTLEDGETVCTATVKVTGAAWVAPRSGFADQVRKKLADTAGTLDV